MTENKKITLSLFASVGNFIITIFIGLVITPYIVNELGSEAYGFVGLANNFVSYASLITIALNSMASRFVSIEIYKKNYSEANKYFSSVFFANIIIAILILPIAALTVWKLETLIEIPPQLITDVKIAFAIVFFQFIINIFLAHFEISTFATNKLYLSQRNQIISSALRLLSVVFCFALFSTKVSFLTLGYLIGHIFIHIMNIYYTKKFIPQLTINRKFLDFSYIKTLVSAGVWSLINRLSSILMDGFDLLISNTFIGAEEMGLLALSKTVPAMFGSLRGTLDYPFTPSMTRCYAEGDIPGVVRFARFGNKLLVVFLIAPMATFVVYGTSFFKLWTPKEDSNILFILSALACLSLVSGSCINSVFSIFTITNKLKAHSIVVLTTAFLTLITNFIVLSATDFGIYAIAGVSSFFSLLRNYIFTPLYGAHCLKVKKSTFYHEVLSGNICLALNIVLGFLLQKVFVGDSWITLILSCGVMVCICILLNSFIAFTKDERKTVLNMAKSKLQKKRS